MPAEDSRCSIQRSPERSHEPRWSICRNTLSRFISNALSLLVGCRGASEGDHQLCRREKRPDHVPGGHSHLSWLRTSSAPFMFAESLLDDTRQQAAAAGSRHLKKEDALLRLSSIIYRSHTLSLVHSQITFFQHATFQFQQNKAVANRHIGGDCSPVYL